MSRPKLLLINPGHGATFWGLEGAAGLDGRRYSVAPLALATVAALTPSEWDIRIVDENVEELDLAEPCDVVGITAMNLQAERAFVLADAFRRQGRTVVMGGPFVTLQAERCEPHADVLVLGEAERIWPRFCRDFLRGEHRPRYVESARLDLAECLVPRYDLLKPDTYAALPVQTSRGCPFSCEFCDVVIMAGGRVRTKPVERVLDEIEAIRRTGADSIFFTDDNFIGNPRYARSLLAALTAQRLTTEYTPQLFTQVSLNLADKPDLLSSMVQAGFTRVFVGIETPRQASLLETGKHQNLRGSLIERVQRIQRAGLLVWAGMIVGFDHDDATIFEEQAEFIQEAGIPVAMIGMLMAIPGTPLHDRLAREGRLVETGGQDGDNCGLTNIVPARMTRAELFEGYARLLERIYGQERFAERVLANVCRMDPPQEGQTSARLPSLDELRALARAVGSFTLSRDPAYRRHFLPNFLRVVTRAPARLVEGAISLGLWRHFATYVPELCGTLRRAAGAERVAEREQRWRAQAASSSKVLMFPQAEPQTRRGA